MTYAEKREAWAWCLLNDPRPDALTKLVMLYIAGLTSAESPGVDLTNEEIHEGLNTTPLAVIAERVGLPAFVVEALA